MADDETSDQPAPRDVWTSVRLSPEAVKVLAHPLRSRLLSALRIGRTATATSLAADLGTNTGATSYHLRRLAEVGLVEETGEGRGRERWWRPTTEMHEWTEDLADADPDARAAVGWLRDHYLRQFFDRAERWLSVHDGLSPEWQRVSGASDYLLDLTAAQVKALVAELTSVVVRHHSAATEANADLTARIAAGDVDPASLPPAERVERVVLYLHTFPETEVPR